MSSKLKSFDLRRNHKFSSSPRQVKVVKVKETSCFTTFHVAHRINTHAIKVLAYQVDLYLSVKSKFLLLQFFSVWNKGIYFAKCAYWTHHCTEGKVKSVHVMKMTDNVFHNKFTNYRCTPEEGTTHWTVQWHVNIMQNIGEVNTSSFKNNNKYKSTCTSMYIKLKLTRRFVVMSKKKKDHKIY